MRTSRVWTACAATIVAGAVLSLVWPGGAGSQVVAPEGWRCYPAKGSPKFVPTDITLNGTLQKEGMATVLKPAFYCDPVNSITNSTLGPALACYKIRNDASKFEGAQPNISSPLGNETLELKKSKLFCLPVTSF